MHRAARSATAARASTTSAAGPKTAAVCTPPAAAGQRPSQAASPRLGRPPRSRWRPPEAPTLPPSPRPNASPCCPKAGAARAARVCVISGDSPLCLLFSLSPSLSLALFGKPRTTTRVSLCSRLARVNFVRALGCSKTYPRAANRCYVVERHLLPPATAAALEVQTIALS